MYIQDSLPHILHLSDYDFHSIGLSSEEKNSHIIEDMMNLNSESVQVGPGHKQRRMLS